MYTAFTIETLLPELQIIIAKNLYDDARLGDYRALFGLISLESASRQLAKNLKPRTQDKYIEEFKSIFVTNMRNILKPTGINIGDFFMWLAVIYSNKYALYAYAALRKDDHVAVMGGTVEYYKKISGKACVGPHICAMVERICELAGISQKLNLI